jgi:hypothetical protein
MFLCKLTGVLFDLVRDPFRKTSEMLVQNAMHVQELVHAGEVADRSQRAAKQQPIEPRQDAHDPILVPIKKSLHDALQTTNFENGF